MDIRMDDKKNRPDIKDIKKAKLISNE